MKCFKIECVEHHPNTATWLGGMLLASLGSPYAIPMLSGTVQIDHFPTAREGLYLERRTANMLTVLQFESDEFKYALVDNAVTDVSGGFEAGTHGYCDVLKRASVETRGDKLWLTAEHAGEEDGALVVLDAGRGDTDYLDYELNGCQVLQAIAGQNPVILAAMSPGQTITAVRSNWRWWNLLGFELRKTIEKIDISFDGANIHLRNQRVPA